ncbi:MAG: NfeD family protein [Lachnospiraceae bacterium]
MEPVFWLVVLVVLLVIEIATLGLTTIWFAGGSLIAFLVSLFGGPLWLQILLFLVVSLLLLYFTRPFAVKYINRDRVRTNVNDIVGRHAVVKERIDNLNAAGLVSINGMDWTARSENESVIIEEGAEVVVTAVRGVKVIVKEPGKE